MRDFWSQLRNPITSVKVSSRQEVRSHYIFNKRRPLTDEEKLVTLVNTTLNKRQKDGRIYALSETGEYSSHSVSPYAETFLDNIEDGIKPLVLALKDKCYLTISSCESHGLSFRRYVTIVFPSQETAEDFLKGIPFHIDNKLFHCTEFLNNSVDIDQHGKVSNSHKIAPQSNSFEMSLEYVNTMFQRRYADAWFLELTISPAIDIKSDWHYVTKLPAIIKKILFTSYYTNRLIHFVKTQLEKNIY